MNQSNPKAPAYAKAPAGKPSSPSQSSMYTVVRKLGRGAPSGGHGGRSSNHGDRRRPSSTGGAYHARPATSGSSAYHARPATGGNSAGYRGRSSTGGSSAYHARPSSGGYRGGGRGGFGGGRTGNRGAQKQFRDVSKFINKAVITEEVPNFKPEHSFLDFKIEEGLKANILKKGYSDPTPIQDRAIPHVLAGQDVVGIANTGTGKTAAFLIPLVNKILKDRKEKVLIMVPTRELATQIDDELRDFALLLSIFSVCCVGGAPIARQMANLRRINNFVIGTPGRLKDLVERRCINLAEFKTVVLDEADRMLDMGFIHDMRFMLAKMPALRQTLFFSATMSPEVNALIKDFLREPVSISVKTGDTAKSINQDVVRVGARNKLDVLHELLGQGDFSRVLIFGRTKHGVERLKDELVKRGVSAESIHGNKNQSKRQRALDLFKNNHLQVLVATDVAARGIDVSDISHVINYDLPSTYEDYIHRIGRTGRAGKNGKALTFID